MSFPDYPIPDAGMIPPSSKHTTGNLHILIDTFCLCSNFVSYYKHQISDYFSFNQAATL